MVRAQLLEVGQAAGTPQPFDLPLALDRVGQRQGRDRALGQVRLVDRKGRDKVEVDELDRRVEPIGEALLMRIVEGGDRRIDRRFAVQREGDAN
ncbi:hypothetical protein LTR94_037108, partial [Friedmanniomyces endolithicus]